VCEYLTSWSLSLRLTLYVFSSIFDIDTFRKNVVSYLEVFQGPCDTSSGSQIVSQISPSIPISETNERNASFDFRVWSAADNITAPKLVYSHLFVHSPHTHTHTHTHTLSAWVSTKIPSRKMNLPHYCHNITKTHNIVSSSQYMECNLCMLPRYISFEVVMRVFVEWSYPRHRRLVFVVAHIVL